MAAAPVLPPSPMPTPEPAPLSQGARIVDTFIAPSKTFTDLRRNASWWAPWLLISIVSMVFIWSMGKQVGFEQISKNQIAHSKRADQFDKLPADQQAKQLALSSKIIAGFGYGSPALLLLYCLIATLPLWLTFKLAVGGIDAPKALTDGEFSERRCPFFFPGGAVEEIRSVRGVGGHRDIVPWRCKLGFLRSVRAASTG